MPYSRFNLPQVKPTMAPYQKIRTVYDFTRDKKHNLITAPSGTQNFDEMTAAAAEGCDFKSVHDALRSGRVTVSNQQLNTPTGSDYRDTTLDPQSFTEINELVKEKAAAVMEAYLKLPESYRNGKTVKQVMDGLKNGDFENFAKAQAAIQELEALKNPQAAAPAAAPAATAPATTEGGNNNASE